jgi:hypothetical protein
LNVARDEEMLALFHAANFRRFFVGIETSDVAKLVAMNKQQNTELDIREAVRRIQSYNITVWAGIILGLDGDDAETFEEQYRFIMDAGITPTLIGLLQAMPGAPLYERIQREGRLRVLPDVVGSNSMGSLEAQGRSNVQPLSLALPSLLRGFSGFVRRVYEPGAYGDRLLASTARGLRPHPSVLKALHVKNTKIILRMVRWYASHEDRAVPRLLVRVLATGAARRGQGLEELIYHLVIYKHLRQFYFDTARVVDEAARSAPERGAEHARFATVGAP